MDKQSSKKPFFIMPEWAWAIVVGMFMLLLFLNHVIPGHAADESPSPTVTPIPTSAIDPTDACLTIYIVGQSYMLFDEDSSTVLSYLQQYDNGLITRSELLDLAYFSRDYLPGNDNSAFFRDVKIALTQLKYQFTGFFVNLIDAWATLGAYESLYYAVSEVGVPISQDYGEYSTNRVLYMANGIYIDVPIWVWNTAIPTPSPVPEDSHISFIAQIYGRYTMIDVVGVFSPASVSEVNNQIFALSKSDFNLNNSFVRPSVQSLYYYSGKYLGVFAIYVPLSSFSDIVFYDIGTVLVSEDPDYIRENFSPASVNIAESNSFRSDTWGNPRYNYFYQDGLLGIGYTGAGTNPFISCSMDFGYLFNDSASYYDLVLFKYNQTVNNTNLLYQGYRLGCEEYATNPLPTFPVTPTPAPLPTSGESIHVILPTGTPSPTPPFTVPGGSDGSSGSDSPGSIGSGLSSGQTSGVLQAWNMYVSDNPAMLFLTSTFQSLPPELLYPLYILLFILLLLAVIRLFVHFSGG